MKCIRYAVATEPSNRTGSLEGTVVLALGSERSLIIEQLRLDQPADSAPKRGPPGDQVGNGTSSRSATMIGGFRHRDAVLRYFMIASATSRGSPRVTTSAPHRPWSRQRSRSPRAPPRTRGTAPGWVRHERSGRPLRAKLREPA